MLGWFRIAGKHLQKKHEHNKIGPPKPPHKKKSQRGEASLVVSSPERKYNTDTHYWKHQTLTVRNVNANTMAQTYCADASMSVYYTIWILKPYAGFDICSIWCSSIEPCLSQLWTLPHRKNTRARWIIPQHLDALPHRLQIDKEFRVACSGHTSVLLPWNGCCVSTQAISNSLQRWMMHHRGRGICQEAIAEQKNQRSKKWLSKHHPILFFIHKPIISHLILHHQPYQALPNWSFLSESAYLVPVFPQNSGKKKHVEINYARSRDPEWMILILNIIKHPSKKTSLYSTVHLY